MALSLALTMAIMFAINAIPVFMPPSWIFLAYIYLTQGGNLLALALLGAFFSTLGGVALAALSAWLGNRYLKGNLRRNIAYVEGEINKRPKSEFAFSFVYALAPLPSNSLFIVAGAAKLRLNRIASGFFLGRIVSYYTILSSVKYAMDRFNFHLAPGNHYSLVISIFGFLLAIAIITVDWRRLIRKRRKRS